MPDHHYPGGREYMRVTLVQPPSGLYDTGDLAPPLGLLTIAAVLEGDGIQVSVVDMNIRGITDHAWVEFDFYAHAVTSIARPIPMLWVLHPWRWNRMCVSRWPDWSRKLIPKSSPSLAVRISQQSGRRCWSFIPGLTTL